MAVTVQAARLARRAPHSARLSGLALVAVLLLLTGLSLLSYSVTGRLLRDEQWVDHTYRVLERFSTLRAALNEAELTHAAVMAAQRPEDRDAFAAATASAEDALTTLRTLTVDDPAQQRRVILLDGIIRDRLLFRQAQLIDPSMRQPPPLILTNELFAVREVINSAEASEQSLLRERLASSEATARQMQLAILGGGGVALLIAGVAGASALHATRERDAATAALAHNNAQLDAQVRQQTRALREANQQLHVLSRQLLNAQEQERRYIARELHDQVGQALTALQLNLQLAAERDSVQTQGLLIESTVLTEQVLEQVRALSLDLRPSLLDDLGLPAALRWFAHRQAERAGFVAHVHTDLATPRLPTEVETACFRIAQEVLTNIVRHAHASTVHITLQQHDNIVQLSIRDDGCGFDVALARVAAAGGHSFGLLSMQERATLLGGTCNIFSTERIGTTVTVRLPMDASEQAVPTKPV